MKKISFIIEKTDGTIIACEDREEFGKVMSDLIEKQEFRGGFRLSEIVKEIHARDEQIDLIYSELRQAPKFVTKLRKNGVYADGTPRLVIPIPRKLFKEGWWLNPDSEHGIIITSHWAINEIGNDPGDEGPPETDD